MVDQPGAEDATDCLLSIETAVVFGERINRTKIRLLHTQDNSLALDGGAAS